MSSRPDPNFFGGGGSSQKVSNLKIITPRSFKVEQLKSHTPQVPPTKNLTTSLVPQRGKAGRHTNTPGYREVTHLDTLIM